MFPLLNLIKLLPLDIWCSSKLLSSKGSQGSVDPNIGSDGNQMMLLIVASTMSNTGVGTFSFIRHFIRISLMQNILLKGIVCYNNLEEYLNSEWNDH